MVVGVAAEEPLVVLGDPLPAGSFPLGAVFGNVIGGVVVRVAVAEVIRESVQFVNRVDAPLRSGTQL